MQLFQTGKETQTQPKMQFKQRVKEKVSFYKITWFAKLILPYSVVDGWGCGSD